MDPRHRYGILCNQTISRLVIPYQWLCRSSFFCFLSHYRWLEGRQRSEAKRTERRTSSMQIREGDGSLRLIEYLLYIRDKLQSVIGYKEQLQSVCVAVLPHVVSIEVYTFIFIHSFVRVDFMSFALRLIDKGLRERFVAFYNIHSTTCMKRKKIDLALFTIVDLLPCLSERYPKINEWN